MGMSGGIGAVRKITFYLFLDKLTGIFPLC